MKTITILLLVISTITFSQTTLTLNDVSFDKESGTITKYPGNEESIIIPSFFTIDGTDYPVKILGENAFSWKYGKIKHIKLPETIEEIQDNAFERCGLVTINLPTNLKKIGWNAFTSNSLEEINLPSNLESVAQNSFLSNKLKKLTIPDNLIEIGHRAFAGNQITELIIGNGVKKMGWGAFNGNKIEKINGKEHNGLIYARNTDGSINNKEIVSYAGSSTTINFIPPTVKTIQTWAFWTSNITKIEIPNSVTFIGGGAFISNYNLAEIVLPTPTSSITGYTAHWVDQLLKKADKITNNNHHYKIKQFPIEYTITYHCNNGIANNPSTYNIESSTFKLNAPILGGFTFEGWYDNKDFNGSPITEIIRGQYSNIELWAKFDNPTSLPSINSNKIKIYPIPANRFIYIEHKSDLPCTVKLYSLTGQLIYQQSLNNNKEKIDVSSFQKGHYILEVINKAETLTHHINIK